MKNPRPPFQYAVFLLLTQGKSRGPHGTGAVQLPVVKIAAMVIVTLIDFTSLSQMFKRFFAKALELLPAQEFGRWRCWRLSRAPFSGLSGLRVDFVAQLERQEPLHEGDIHERSGEVPVERVPLAVLFDGFSKPGERLIVVPLPARDSAISGADVSASDIIVGVTQNLFCLPQNLRGILGLPFLESNPTFEHAHDCRHFRVVQL